MKIYWATPGFDDWLLEKWQTVLSALAQNGFSGVEPLIAGPYTMECSSIKQLLGEHGMELFGVRTGGISLKHGVFFNDSRTERRREAVARFLEITHYVSHFGSPRLLTGLMQGNLLPGQTSAEAEELIAEALAECSQAALGYGMEIDLEAVNRFEVNHHNQVKQMADFLSLAGAGNIRLLIDTFHMNIEETNIEEAVLDVKDTIGHVHLADSNRRVPGSGHFDFNSFFHILKLAGYSGSLTVEAQTDASREEIENTALFLKKIAECEVEKWI